MPCTAVYFLNRSTLAAFSCSSPVSTASGPSSSVIAATIEGRLSTDRDEVMVWFPLTKRSADQVATVDDQHVAVDVVGGPAGQEHDRAHQVGDLAPARRRDVLDDAAIGVRVGAGGRGDGGLEVAGRDGVDLDVVRCQLVAVGLGEADDSRLGGGVGR